MLELLKQWRCGFTMLSTSRVYSIRALAAIPVETAGDRFVPRADAPSDTQHASRIIRPRLQCKRRRGRLLNRAPVVPLRQLQTRLGAARVRVCRELRSACVHPPLRRAGRRRPVWQDRPGHLLLLDSLVLPAAPAEIHWVQGHRLPGARLPARPRLAPVDRAADRKPASGCASRAQRKRWTRPERFTAAVERLVR